MADEARDEALAWLDKAEQDLSAARLILQGKGPSTVGCYLGQQALEKLLKAVLVFRGLGPPRSHDLVDLHRRVVACGFDPQVSAADLAAWTDYAVAGRYPGFGDLESERDLLPLLTCAADLARCVRSTLTG